MDILHQNRFTEELMKLKLQGISLVILPPITLHLVLYM